MLGNRYMTGKSYGSVSFNSGYNFFSAWHLETWNSFCITADSKAQWDDTATQILSLSTYINEGSGYI